MKVFLSWSGEPSRSIAQTLRKFLPCMIQGLDVFVSKHDIESGGRWGAQLAAELESSSFGILCLTAQNQNAPWLVFEAGALTKLSEGRACGLLLDDLTPANVAGPLAQFQHRRMDREDFPLLLRDMNAKLAAPLKEDQLQLVIDKWWPDIEAEYKALLTRRTTKPKDAERRQDRELLEEILERIRFLGNRAVRTVPAPIVSDAEVAAAGILKILRALPPEELEFMRSLNHLKDAGDADGVAQLEALAPALVASLLQKGLLYRGSQGTLFLNRFVGDTVLPKLDQSDIETA